MSTKIKWIMSHTGAVLVMALCIVTLYFYQLPTIIYPLWLKHQAGGHITRAALTSALRAHDGQIAIAIVVMGLIQIGLLLWLYRHQLKRRNPLHINRKPFRLESFFFLCAMYGLVLCANMVVARFGTPANQQAILHEMQIMPVTLFFLAALLGPVIEELIFRGVSMNLFWLKDNRLNTVCAVVASGLVFGFMHEPHLSWFLLLYSSLGAILAYTYRYHRDLRYSLGLHIFINLPAAVLALLQVLAH